MAGRINDFIISALADISSLCQLQPSAENGRREETETKCKREERDQEGNQVQGEGDRYSTGPLNLAEVPISHYGGALNENK